MRWGANSRKAPDPLARPRRGAHKKPASAMEFWRRRPAVMRARQAQKSRFSLVQKQRAGRFRNAIESNRVLWRIRRGTLNSDSVSCQIFMGKIIERCGPSVPVWCVFPLLYCGPGRQPLAVGPRETPPGRIFPRRSAGTPFRADARDKPCFVSAISIAPRTARLAPRRGRQMFALILDGAQGGSRAPKLRPSAEPRPRFENLRLRSCP